MAVTTRAAELPQVQSPEAPAAKPAQAEKSLGQKAAEGLKKAVGTARERLTDFVRPGLRAKKAAGEARANMTPQNQQEQSVANSMRMEGRTEESINAHLNRFRQEEAQEEESVRKTMRMEGRTEESIDAHIARMKAERRSNRVTRQTNEVASRLSGQQENTATGETDAQKIAKLEADNARLRRLQSKNNQDLVALTTEARENGAKVEQEIARKKIEQVTAENKRLIAENEQLRKKKPTRAEMQKEIDKAVAEALKKHSATEKPATPSSSPTETTVAKPTETQPNSEVAALRGEVAELRRQLQDTQTATKQAIDALNIQNPELKKRIDEEKKKGGAANWLFLFPAILAYTANKKNEAGQAA